jgi:Protein of unknown function (DUF2637)/HTH domain
MTATSAPDTACLRRIQAGARATLALGIGASLTANMLAAHPSLIGRLVAGWSPVALMLTVELLSRVPTSNSRLSHLRVAAAAAIAGIAAWVSYWHMVQVSLAAGEASIAAHLLPLSVDGLVVVASICLVEITNRLNASQGGSRRPSPSEPGPAQRTAPQIAATPAGPARPARDLNGSAGATGGSAGEQVRLLAAEHPDWTQAELAEAAGCSVRTVRRYLSTRPSASPLDQPDTTDLGDLDLTTPVEDLAPSSPEDRLMPTSTTRHTTQPNRLVSTTEIRS